MATGETWKAESGVSLKLFDGELGKELEGSTLPTSTVQTLTGDGAFRWSPDFTAAFTNQFRRTKRCYRDSWWK